ncbi:sperm-specific sodium:proton exchanger-like isoform X2 [Dermacentor variabilis]|uniref:sperm-specific sodium:proton exchanger-like isoform X2 n=1 Tax=Dermacentor variabilis TaxID=34621 RepID=UPI003F5C892B
MDLTTDANYFVDNHHRTYYLALFAFFTMSTMLKTIQRHIRVPYTLVVFVVAAGCTTLYAMTSKRIDFYYGSIGVQAITVFMPAFVVHTTQGINNYIFRRCHIEITIFSLGTFGITLALATVFVTHRIADSTWPFRECLLFGVYMCLIERLPMSDALFEEGRYPVMTTMMQSEALFNAVMTWCIFGYYRFHEGGGLDLMFPLQNQGVAMFVGLLMGTATVCLLDATSAFSGDSAITVIVCGTYFTYFFLENVHSSGVTGVVVYTMVVNSHRFVACTDLSRALEDYWDILYDVTGTLASCVSASYTAVLLIQYAPTLDWVALWTCYVVKAALRCLAVVVLYPVIGHFGYQVTVRQAMVLAWMSVKGTFLASIATVQHLRRENVYTESITKSYLYAIGDMSLTQLINVTFLPVVLGALGVLEVSDVELRTMRDAVQYLKEAADSARALYLKDDSFLLADWRWVTRSTLLRNPLEATFRFQSAMRTGCVVRLRKVPRHIDTLAVENVLRIEQVSYARQYRQGIIQRRTKLTLIAALQYPFDKKVYLDMDIIGSILAVPKWVIWLKESLNTIHEKGLMEDTFSGSEVMPRPLRERVVELFEHAYYEVVITSSTLAVVFVLCGLVRIVMVTPRGNAFIGAIAVEALYLTMFTTEVTIMISAYGQRIMNMDNYNRLDLVLVAVCMFIFTLQCGLFIVNQNDLANNALIVCFTIAISLRFLHAIKYAELSLERMAEIVHRYLDARIYDAYEIGHAIVTGEEEVQQSVWKFVNNDNITADIRGRATLNRLLVLRRLVEIQSRFPGIMVAFRSRQASTAILDDVTKNVQEHQAEGLLDSEAGQELLAIQIRPVSFAPGEVIVERGEENPILLTYSGILKIEGEFENPRNGSLPNSVSQLFFYNEGYFLDYVSAPACLGVLGLVTDEPSITRVVAETQINAYVVPRERVVEAIQIFTRPPSFLYQIWSYIARIIAFMVLQTHPKYQTWPLDKISRRLESFLLPDLERCSKFTLTAEIEDAILIQGTALDPETQDYFVAPIYLPSQAMKITFPFYQERLRPVMLIIASKGYKLPPEVDWLQTKVDEEKQNEYEENFKVANTTAERGDDLTEKAMSHRQSMDLY